MSHYLGLFFDIVMLVALGATIFHAHRLSKQFNQMQADRKAFDALISALNLAASKAETAIKHLRDSAMESAAVLQERTGKAKALAEELEIMVQAGDNLADRLGKLAEASRKSAPAQDPFGGPFDDRDYAAPKSAQPRTKAEKELLDALKAKQK